jgi:hypothetical protein
MTRTGGADAGSVACAAAGNGGFAVELTEDQARAKLTDWFKNVNYSEMHAEQIVNHTRECGLFNNGDFVLRFEGGRFLFEECPRPRTRARR